MLKNIFAENVKIIVIRYYTIRRENSTICPLFFVVLKVYKKEYDFSLWYPIMADKVSRMEVRQHRGRILIGKLGLDGHDRGAKIIARSLCNDGFEVIYTGIRRTPEEIASAAIQEDVDAIGLSLLSGAHNELIPALLYALRQAKGGDIPVIIGGIIPREDIPHLKKAGIREVFTSGTPIQTILDAFRKITSEHWQNKHTTS